MSDPCSTECGRPDTGLPPTSMSALCARSGNGCRRNMKTVSDYHDRAMELADLALQARRSGDGEQSEAHDREALVSERRAAEMVAPDLGAEPTRSVLHRSAASLAVQCGEFREAERLIAVALSGNPPE